MDVDKTLIKILPISNTFCRQILYSKTHYAILDNENFEENLLPKIGSILLSNLSFY